MKKTKSKKYKLNSFDILRGFLIACVGAGLMTLQQLLDSNEINYKSIAMAALSGGVAYLIKNFFTDETSNEKNI